MRAYVFVRYHSGDGAGHVGWGFETADGRVCCGSVENHSGHLFTPASAMGFWCVQTHAHAHEFLTRGYDDVCTYEVASPDDAAASAVTRWIEHSAYRAIARNCEDDVYDVLRTYGVNDLEPPFFNWFPRLWFTRLTGRKTSIASMPHLHPADAPLEQSGAPELPPLRPPWRAPLHPRFHRLHLAKTLRLKGLA